METLYPVTNNTANQGGTRLIPAPLLTPALRATISGEAVVSVTLDQLISFAGARTAVIKLDIEVSIHYQWRHRFPSVVMAMAPDNRQFCAGDYVSCTDSH